MLSSYKKEKRFTITENKSLKRIDILVDGIHFTSCIYPDNLMKPVLYPICTAEGTFVTRGWPIDSRPGERIDHPHHVGMWFNYGNVNGLDFWNNSTAISAENKGDITVYEWMKRWGYELHNNYGRSDGLIDVGFSTKKIIEIRTDGYNHVVPVITGLTADFYRRMSEWAFERGDKDASKFKQWSEQIRGAFTKELWNEELGWFDNLYPDGKRGTIWTYHLYDLLESNIVVAIKKRG